MHALEKRSCNFSHGTTIDRVVEDAQTRQKSKKKSHAHEKKMRA